MTDTLRSADSDQPYRPVKPVTQALTGRLDLRPDRLDYGCGRGGDVERLRDLGYSVSGWDPAFAPDEPLRLADVVNLGYVVNVIESSEERAETLRQGMGSRRFGAACIAARLDWEARRPMSQPPAGDGIMTSRGTFQKFYTQYELKTWIESVLGLTAHAAAPGIFYAFRNPADAESLRARQVRQSSAAPRRTISQILYETHSGLLQELAAFLEDRGRLPDRDELEQGKELIGAFGGVRQAFRILCRASGRSDWSAEAARARDNLLVYLALAAFDGRPRMGELPLDLQRDIKELFGSYRAATGAADELLFSLGSAERLSEAIKELPVGKVLAGLLVLSRVHDLDPPAVFSRL